MTVVTLPKAEERISTTSPSSPLAAFRTRSAHHVDVMFANTVVTQNLVNQGDVNYLGTFHKDNLHEARKTFQDYFDGMQEAA